MDFSNHINIGIIHSLIGKNDGVSIVIDQSVHCMVTDMGVDLGKVFFLSAHSASRFNAQTHEIFWHKNIQHQAILAEYSSPASHELDRMIHESALVAKEVIAAFVKQHAIDLIIAHNTSHVYNFITAVGLGYYIEELRAQDIVWPKVIAWWHDSYLERDEFAAPNTVIKKYLKYLPGTYLDGLIVINKNQIQLARQVFQSLDYPFLEAFFRERVVTIPNTSTIAWDWKQNTVPKKEMLFPPQDSYNDSFFTDTGLITQITNRGGTLAKTTILLQHTRVIPRKNIETAIDLAFALDNEFRKNAADHTIALLITGHYGDEQNNYKDFLLKHYTHKQKASPDSRVIINFAEDFILPGRDIIQDKKYYAFDEIPGIVAAHGGIGTYFSTIEGFGNNLLEMAASALPVVINRYEVYKSDIEPLGFSFPSIDNSRLTELVIRQTMELLTNMTIRNTAVINNLSVIETSLDHSRIAEKLDPLIETCFRKILR